MFVLAGTVGRTEVAAQIIRLPPAVASPRITNLEHAIARDRPAAVSAFWATLTREGTPIIEAYPTDSSFILVTFVYRDSTHAKDIVVSNGVAGWTDYFMHLAPIDGTDIWYKTVVLPSTVRIGYQFAVNSPAIPWWVDPNFGARFATWHGDRLNRNDDSTMRVRGARSKFQGPAADPQRFVARQSSMAHGRIDTLVVDSKVLKQQRRIWVYTPPTDGGRPAAERPVLVMFDGRAYTADAWVPTPTILDNMIAAGRIQPVVAVFVDNGAARMQELGCDSLFSAFVATEVMPAVRQRVSFATGPANAVIGGSSHGGLGATCTALRFPGVFGNVISQSGSYWWAPPGEEEEWPSRAFAARPKLPIRFYVEVGLFETDRSNGGGPGQVITNRHFRDVLRAKGYDVMYSEFPGAHEYFNWRGTLSGALEHFFPPRRNSRPSSRSRDVESP